MAQVLHFPKEYFVKDNHRPLTLSMLKSLERAYDKQKEGVLFGPKDIKGSVTPLIKRGLIASRLLKSGNEVKITWYVTDHAINILDER